MKNPSLIDIHAHTYTHMRTHTHIHARACVARGSRVVSRAIFQTLFNINGAAPARRLTTTVYKVGPSVIFPVCVVVLFWSPYLSIRVCVENIISDAVLTLLESEFHCLYVHGSTYQFR